MKNPPAFHVCDNCEPCLRLTPGVRLRREHFGGIVFDTRTGLTLDVDRAAFTWLWTAREYGITPNGADAAENRLLAQLLEQGMVTVAPAAAGPPAGAVAGVSPAHWPALPRLTAPETVHWAITYRCTARCPDCYARRCREETGSDLDSAGALHLVDRLAQWGVLQLAIGGGEPLLRPDLAEIAAHARAQGIVVHVTTGYHRLTYPELAPFAPGITTLQIGIKPERLLGDATAEIELLAETVENAREMPLLLGANLMLSRTVIAHFSGLLAALHQAGFTRLTLLRYKPPADVERWRQEAPTADDMLEFEQRLPALLLAAVPEMTVRLDCALSYLQRHIAPEDALASGVRGCVAADRILALAPDGGIYPCSQLVHPRFYAGNMLADDAQAIWATSPVLQKFRHVRKQRAFRESWCGICRANTHCKGCRVFAHDLFGGETACTEPLIPPLTALGKIGRQVEFARFIAGRGMVSVKEYMARYGVDRKTAVRELNASPHAKPSDHWPKKQSPHYYQEKAIDIIAEIQSAAGCTDAGFPYVTREEIRGWMDEWNNYGYPEWLSPRRGPEATVSPEWEGEDNEDY